MTLSNNAIPRPPHRGRRTMTAVITWIGYVVFGLPAALAVPAMASTVTRFGAWPAATQALPAAATAVIPLMLWVRYTRHRPTTRRGKLAWLVVAAAAIAAVALSPLFFWSGPVLLVLCAELLRLLLNPALTKLPTRTPTRNARGTSKTVARTRQ